AYFAGRTLGKHKLCPKLSPKKTVEGAIGGTLGCVICICVYAYLCGKCKVVSVNYISATFFAILTAVFSQFGDLAASRIKREYGVKDYGNLIPGHGGILDRFDSALLISPLVYYFTLYFPVIIK
ncbi:MAG: phosphatidate cytidylyltransferase, partial [Clostridia bacterium]|nr:phosphatidate cytidylyltransferase [Clostridia bacterium]